MSENQIKVNNIEELISQAETWMENRGGVEKVRLGNISANSPTYTFRKGSPVQTEKEHISMELRGENGSLVKFKMEAEADQEEFSGLGKIPKKTLDKALTEVNKIIPDTRPKPFANKTPKKEDNSQSHSLNIRAVPCSSLEEVKKQIKDFYQKNREEIHKKPEFSHWIEITEIGLFSNYSEVGKNGETITSGSHNNATILLKGADRTENGKTINEQINLLLKTKSGEWGGEVVDWPEKELKEYWNTVLEQKGNPPIKNLQNEIEKLKQEISELENNPQTKNNSEKQKVLERKRNKLNELLKENNDTSSSQLDKSNLALYLGISGIILLIGGLFLIKLLRKRKKVVK